jgi:two-component system sensor histidine kinase KdpD
VKRGLRVAWGGLPWLVAWAALLAHGPDLDLAVGALVLVLATTLSAIFWPLALNGVAIGASLLAFNWQFVPPRGSLQIALVQHLWLLLTLASCGGLVAWLVARQRRAVDAARTAQARSEGLGALGSALRDADDPVDALLTALAPLSAQAPCALSADGDVAWGAPSAHARTGLLQCARLRSAFGPGTGRHEDEADWYLPLRGALTTLGAACLRPAPEAAVDAAALAHAQALCDLAGQALERRQAVAQAQAANEAAAQQRLRNTVLAGVAHDHRTPLAAILTAVSGLREQGDRLDAAQREQRLHLIQDEAEQLLRIAENSLQLARLGETGEPDAPLALRCDWQAPEELVGSVLARVRRRDLAQRIKAYVAPGLPLLRCDAVLVVQALDNLLDNALRHGGDGAVALRAERRGDRLWLAVRDRGPGVPLAERDGLFTPYRRGPNAQGRGAGLGLALAQAVAQAHGGRLRLRDRDDGPGSSFELELPLPPDEPSPAAA